MNVKTATLGTTYKHVMMMLAAGEPVDDGLFQAATVYAKTSKRRAPKRIVVAKAIEAPKKPAKKAAKKSEPKAPKAPKVIKKCSATDCQTDAYSKGLCTKHYTAKRREDPIEKAKANAASKAYRTRLAVELAKAKEAAAEKAAAKEAAKEAKAAAALAS
jgi:hypothetical protein